MEFNAWLKAEFNLDAATLTAEQRPKFEAKFAAAYPGGQATEPPKPVVAAAAGSDGVGELELFRNRMAAEHERVAAIDKIPDITPAISAQAIKEGWTLEKTELTVLRASRTGTQAGASETGPQIIIKSAMPKDGLGPARFCRSRLAAARRLRAVASATTFAASSRRSA